ncbi:hypothetical protein V1477_012827 [Vespula maculifrons]|uniref:Uncharacterized protein n=1 Tax=Vespula maculifrons TaxID=7453 RepID=A0ABD2BU56_VESMC
MASALWCSDNEEEKEEKEEEEEEEEKEKKKKEEEVVESLEIKKSGPKTTDPGEKLINDVQNLIRTAVAYCPGASCTSYLDSQLLTAMKSAIVAPFAGDNCPLWRSKGIAAWTMDRKFLAFVQQTVSSIVRRRKMLERRVPTMA